MDVRGYSIFIMIPGYNCETAEEVALQHNIAMATREESDKDFCWLLVEGHIVEPTNKHEAQIMLQGMADLLDLLAGDPCIASSSYAGAAELVSQHERTINRLMQDPGEPYFLLRLLNQVNHENYFLFREFFDNIKATGTGCYQMTMDGVNRHDKEIGRLFEGLKMSRTIDLKLPPNFLSLLEPQKREEKIPHGRRGGGGGGGGGVNGRKRKRTKVTPVDGDRPAPAPSKKAKRDAWSAPKGVANPLDTYSPNTITCNVNRDQFSQIKIKHHTKQHGRDDFALSLLCLSYQVEGFCPCGTKCLQNHRSRTAMLNPKNCQNFEDRLK